jgi:membrane associated rhomboid family serine protease
MRRIMSDPRRLSRPLYEALPWLYILSGVAALAASYFAPSRLMSVVLGFPGLIATVGGIVLVLKRRDFRRMRADYVNTHTSVLPKGEE